MYPGIFQTQKMTKCVFMVNFTTETGDNGPGFVI